jgi:hypothetical protein
MKRSIFRIVLLLIMFVVLLVMTLPGKTAVSSPAPIHTHLINQTDNGRVIPWPLMALVPV